jgi:hypothetical protein
VSKRDFIKASPELRERTMSTRSEIERAVDAMLEAGKLEHFTLGKKGMVRLAPVN